MTPGGGRTGREGSIGLLPASTCPSAWFDVEADSVRLTRRASFWLAIVAVCTASGVLFAFMSPNGPPWVGGMFGGLIGTSVMLYEQGLLAPGLRRRVRALPLALGVVGTELIYVVLIVLASALAGTMLKLAGILNEDWSRAVLVTPSALVYALVVSGTIITVNRMRELIGGDVFRNLLLGRYHHPVEEERIFLFVDLIGSTAYAQQHGDVRAQAFLGAIFAELAEPVRRCRGTIDDYVGDMAMVTWPLAAGVAQARCVRCVFAFMEAIDREAERWQREFGQVPRFQAALHGGRVVTAEVGRDRHKIAYFGDVVNTTGRLEGLCRALHTPVLISADLVERIPTLPAGIAVTDLGAHACKGRGEPLRVLGLALDAPAGYPARSGQPPVAGQPLVPNALTA